MANKLKLTVNERKQIRKEYSTGEYTQNQLARKWKVGVATIRAIINRTTVIDMENE